MLQWLNLLMHNQKDREKPDVVEGLKLGHPESNMPSSPHTGWSYTPALAHMTLTSKYRNKALLEPSLSLVTKTANSSREMHKRNAPVPPTVMHQKPFSVEERLHLEWCSYEMVFSSDIMSMSVLAHTFWYSYSDCAPNYPFLTMCLTIEYCPSVFCCFLFWKYI